VRTLPRVEPDERLVTAQSEVGTATGPGGVLGPRPDPGGTAVIACTENRTVSHIRFCLGGGGEALKL
jgi:hypothetical protein